MGLPIPLKGETFFSFMARTILRSGSKATSHVTLRMGFAAANPLWSPLGLGISAFYRVFPEIDSIISPCDMVWRHTTAPLLIAYSDRCSSEASRQAFANKVVALGGWRSRNRSAGGGKPSGLRDCLDCIAADNVEFGVAYWHREHQIRAVSRCWRHDRALREHRWVPGAGFPAELPGFGRYGSAGSTEMVIGSTSPACDLWLARAFASILDSGEVLSHAELRNHLIDPARSAGVYCRGMPNIEQAFSFVLGTYGTDYLSCIELPVRYTQHTAMRYSRALSKSNNQRDLLAALLLAGALSVPHELLFEKVDAKLKSTSADSKATEGQGAKVQVLRDALERCGYIIGRTATALGLSRAGLIKAIRKAGIKCPIAVGQNSKFNEATIQWMIKDMRTGMEWSELKAKYQCSDEILQTLPIYEPSLFSDAWECRTQKRIEKFRTIVNQAVAEGRNRSEIREYLPTEVSFLNRHDREWLLATLASVKKRKALAPVRGIPGRGGGLDDSRILQVLEGALEVAKALQPPRRVTKTLLVQLGGLRPSLLATLEAGRLPRSGAFLATCQEPYVAFIERKLGYALEQLEAASPSRPITLQRIRFASGLPDSVLVAHQGLVQERVRRSPLPVSPTAVQWLRDARGTGQSA